MVLNTINAILHPIMSPFLLLPTFWGLVALSFIMSVIVTVAYKYTTNQALMRELKAELKKGRDKIKSAKGNPQKQMEIQSKLLKVQNKYMLQSLRPALFTMIPLLLILGWMQAYYAVEPIMPEETFEFTAQFIDSAQGMVTLETEHFTIQGNATQSIAQEVTWQLTAQTAGEHPVFIKTDAQTAEHIVLIGEGANTHRVQSQEGVLRSTTADYRKLIVMPFTLFGWQPGWLATYILFSIIFSLALRKLMKLA